MVPERTPNPRPLTPEAARAPAPGRVWVDVRSECDFAAGHLPGSASLPLPAWAERRHEWPPPRTSIVAVAAVSTEALEAARRLAAAGYTDVAWLDAPWEAIGVPPSKDPPARLWRPAPWLEQAILGLPAGRSRGRALDVACGSGRDAVYLALAGFAVEAWDHDPGALARAGELARRNGVALHTVEADLEAAIAPAFEAGAFELIACFRYLHRPLFPAMADALAPGGTLVVETYRQGQERFGRPRRPRFLLRAGELRDACAGLEILRYEEPSPPGGPWTARIVARRAAP